MNLAGSDAPKNDELYRRLLVKLDRAYAQGVNVGMPTAWLYDATIAAVAVWAASNAIMQGKLSGNEAEECVASIEAVDFNVYGDTSESTLKEGYTVRRKEFAHKVAAPLFTYYKENKDAQEAYPGAEGIIGYIVREWVEKE